MLLSGLLHQNFYRPDAFSDAETGVVKAHTYSESFIIFNIVHLSLPLPSRKRNVLTAAIKQILNIKHDISYATMTKHLPHIFSKCPKYDNSQWLTASRSMVLWSQTFQHILEMFYFLLLLLNNCMHLFNHVICTRSKPQTTLSAAVNTKSMENNDTPNWHRTALGISTILPPWQWNCNSITNTP